MLAVIMGPVIEYCSDGWMETSARCRFARLELVLWPVGGDDACRRGETCRNCHVTNDRKGRRGKRHEARDAADNKTNKRQWHGH